MFYLSKINVIMAVMSHCSNKDCYFHGYGCVIMQLIVSSHANCDMSTIIESRSLKTDCPEV